MNATRVPISIQPDRNRKLLCVRCFQWILVTLFAAHLLYHPSDSEGFNISPAR